MQLEPDAFRCAISIDGLLDPDAWLRPPLPEMQLPPTDAPLESSLPRISAPPFNFPKEVQRAFYARAAAPLSTLSVLRAPERLTKPVLLIVEPMRNRFFAEQSESLRTRLKRLRHAPDYLEVSPAYAAGLPGERAKAFRRMEEFFNLSLYDYNVQIGESKEVK
jgi:hypothetical protein